MQFCKKLTDYREWNRTQHIETELNKRSLNSRHENGVFEKKVTQSLENNWRWTLLLQKRCKHRATIFWTLLAVYPMVCLRSLSGYFHSEKCKSQLARSTLGEAFAEALLSMFIQHLSQKLLSSTTMCLTNHLDASRCFRVLPKYVLIYIMNIYIYIYTVKISPACADFHPSSFHLPLSNITARGRPSVKENRCFGTASPQASF